MAPVFATVFTPGGKSPFSGAARAARRAGTFLQEHVRFS